MMLILVARETRKITINRPHFLIFPIVPTFRRKGDDTIKPVTTSISHTKKKDNTFTKFCEIQSH